MSFFSSLLSVFSSKPAVESVESTTAVSESANTTIDNNSTNLAQSINSLSTSTATTELENEDFILIETKSKSTTATAEAAAAAAVEPIPLSESTDSVKVLTAHRLTQPITNNQSNSPNNNNESSPLPPLPSKAAVKRSCKPYKPVKQANTVTAITTTTNKPAAVSGKSWATVAAAMSDTLTAESIAASASAEFESSKRRKLAQQRQSYDLTYELFNRHSNSNNLIENVLKLPAARSNHHTNTGVTAR